MQITLTTKQNNCPQIILKKTPTSMKSEVKYLGIHVDKKLGNLTLRQEGDK